MRSSEHFAHLGGNNRSARVRLETFRPSAAFSAQARTSLPHLNNGDDVDVVYESCRCRARLLRRPRPRQSPRLFLHRRWRRRRCRRLMIRPRLICHDASARMSACDDDNDVGSSQPPGGLMQSIHLRRPASALSIGLLVEPIELFSYSLPCHKRNNPSCNAAKNGSESSIHVARIYFASSAAPRFSRARNCAAFFRPAEKR